MKVFRESGEFREWASRKDVGFVPTMGAFHEGHLSLMRAAQSNHEFAAVSLFVNPMQFGQGEDFDKYPRDEDRDKSLAEAAGIDAIFIPSSEDLAQSDFRVTVGELGRRWEGAARPGHFDGVATIVAKLLMIPQPRSAYFGRKDLQQCAVVKRLVMELFIPTEIIECSTIREPNGLAMSSRNQYLSSEDRSRAGMIFEQLRHLAEVATTGCELGEEIASAESRLRRDGIGVEYLALIDSDSFIELPKPQPGASIIFAGKLGTTRLIDNIQIP